MSSPSCLLLDLLRVPPLRLSGRVLARCLDQDDKRWLQGVALLSDEALLLLPLGERAAGAPATPEVAAAAPPPAAWVVVPLTHATAAWNGTVFFTIDTARKSWNFRAASARAAQQWVETLSRLGEVANDNALLAAPELLAEDLLELAFAQPLADIAAARDEARAYDRDRDAMAARSTPTPHGPGQGGRMPQRAGLGMRTDVRRAPLPPAAALRSALVAAAPVPEAVAASLLVVPRGQRPPSPQRNDDEPAGLAALLWGLPPRVLRGCGRWAALLEPPVPGAGEAELALASDLGLGGAAPSPLALEAASLACAASSFLLRAHELRDAAMRRYIAQRLLHQRRRVIAPLSGRGEGDDERVDSHVRLVLPPPLMSDGGGGGPSDV